MCQPTQLAAIAIDGRRLTIIENSLFQSYIKPVPEEECEKYGLEPISEEALSITKISKEQLDSAPTLKVVWQSFCEYTAKYRKGKGIFGLPIRSGYNIHRFDNIILDRIMGGNNCYNNQQLACEPYGFGPWDEERREQRLFNPRDCLDMMLCYVWPWTENNADIRSISMQSVMEWLGIEQEGTHNAVVDVIIGAFVLMRFMKLTRSVAPKVKFEKSLANENIDITNLIKQYLVK